MARKSVKKTKPSTTKSAHGKGLVDIAEEAFHLLRSSSLLTLSCYYIGSLPFVLALLYFWTDMSRNAYADERCAQASFGLALLFIWMKCWHAVFAQQLNASLYHVPAPAWPFHRVLRLVIAQTVIQPWGLFLLPLSMLVAVPFPWLYAFYQNITIFGGQDDKDLKSLRKRAWRQAKLWPKQNGLLVWLLSPWMLMTGAALLLVLTPFLSGIGARGILVFLVYLLFAFLVLLSPLGVIVAANLSSALLLIPWMLKTFLGIQTMFSLGPRQMLNSTFFAVVCGLCYLCLDPMVKAVYALRCFYGKALKTGEDLKVELRWLSSTQKADLSLFVLVLCVFTLFSSPLRAEVPQKAGTEQVSSTTMSPAELDDSLLEVMNQPEFSWRMARERERKESEKALPPFLLRISETLQGWGEALGEWFKIIGKWFKAVGEWFRKLFPRKDAEKQGAQSGAPGAFEGGARIQALLYALLAIIACVAALLLWRSLRSQKLKTDENEMGAETPEPDLTEEEVDAGQLPPDEWLTLAQNLIDRGDLRLALRALYLAGLACLAERRLLMIAQYKSDREYAKELQRRSHAFPELLPLFLENMKIFQRSWYGLHEVSRELLEQVTTNYEALKSLVTQSPETE